MVWSKNLHNNQHSLQRCAFNYIITSLCSYFVFYKPKTNYKNFRIIEKLTELINRRYLPKCFIRYGCCTFINV